MKVLELYSGVKWGGLEFKDYGYEVVSIRIELFDYSIYPRGCFDIVFINIDNNNIGLWDDEDYNDMMFGLDVITYYDKYYWIINNTNISTCLAIFRSCLRCSIVSRRRFVTTFNFCSIKKMILL